MSTLARALSSDRRLTLRLALWRSPRWFHVSMLWATRFGDGWGWIALFAALVFGRHAYREVLASVVAALVTSAVFSRLKRRFKRRRPCELLPGLLHEVMPQDRFSFPSGHSATSFAVATVLALSLPALAPVFCLMAATVAASRVMLGLHYVGDVVAGALLGLTLGLLSYRALLS